MKNNVRKIFFLVLISAALLLRGNAVLSQTNDSAGDAPEIKTEPAVQPEPAGSKLQDKPDSKPADEAVSAENREEKNIIKKPEQKPRAGEAKQAYKNDSAIKQPANREEQAVSGDINGLLSIKEGSFKYRRIPGIIIPDDSAETGNGTDSGNKEVVVVNNELEIPEDSPANMNGRGFFGVSKKTGDTIIIIILLVVIIGVVIFLKVKSRGKDENVLRRFPRK